MTTPVRPIPASPIPVSVVPHTHWDREWYSPFQTFRLRLVDLLDELLPRLEGDPSFAHFLLDGQVAVIDDYLAVRPEAEAVLRRLNAAGRIAVGPWYVLMDEFLVSGETMIRNLQLGFDRAAALGGAMEVGYLPDMFGHIAQMPQLLRLAGLADAVVWRGVPAAVDRDAFWWEAPDGSTVRAQYLWPEGYGNGAYLPDDAKELLGRLRTHLEEMGDAFTGSLLWMNGTDHETPRPWLGRVIAEVNDLQDDFALRVVPLAEHLATASRDGLPRITGELRSGARANLLMGVASNRVDVKQAAARAERALERRTEPLGALFLPADRWPSALLDEAWREVIRNSAHDSICACSADEVCAAVLHRYAEATAIANGLGDRAVSALAASMRKPGVVVVNASARARQGLVTVMIADADTVEGGQALQVREAVLLDRTVAGRDLAGLLAPWRSQQLDDELFLATVEVTDNGTDIDIELTAGDRLRTNVVLDEVKADLAELVAGRPDVPVRVRLVQPPYVEALVRVGAPGYGWQAWHPAPLDVEPVTGKGNVLANGLVTVVVDEADGTFSLDGITGFDRLVDGGDHGDTYNYSPPDHDTEVDRPDRVSVELVEAGPLRGQLRVTRQYVLPTHVDDRTHARGGGVDVEVITTIEVRAGERLVRVTTELDNQVRDHRLRTWFPLPERATHSSAECAFAVVRRGLTAEGGPTERPLPTFPSRRFVQAGGLTVVHEGLLEYELVDIDETGAGALALTLLRGTGLLSRVDVTNRPMPAGPPLPLAGAQALGHHFIRYGVAVGDGDPYALVDDAFLPLEVAVADGGGHRAPQGAVLTVDGAQVSSLRRVHGQLELRVFNPTAEGVTVDLDGRSGWVVDLRGRPLSQCAGTIELGPWAIATVRLPD